MDQEEILNNYSKLGISIESVPVYNNPIEFATHFKKCSITKYLDDISYSDSTDI